jgi:hypothetical protein
MSAGPNYEPLPTSADCCVVTIEAALNQIGEEAKRVSSDVYISNCGIWQAHDLQAILQERDCLANRVKVDDNLRPFEWYVECCGTRVGSNPPG